MLQQSGLSLFPILQQSWTKLISHGTTVRAKLSSYPTTVWTKLISNGTTVRANLISHARKLGLSLFLML